jgi:hypothetical protein
VGTARVIKSHPAVALRIAALTFCYAPNLLMDLNLPSELLRTNAVVDDLEKTQIRDSEPSEATLFAGLATRISEI